VTVTFYLPQYQTTASLGLWQEIILFHQTFANMEKAILGLVTALVIGALNKMNHL
jgi:hypothetical protein